MTRSFWIQSVLALILALVMVGILCNPIYPIVRNALGEEFTALSMAHVTSTTTHWTTFKYVARAHGRSGIGAEQAELLRDVVGHLADQNGDTLLVIQAVHRRAHFGALFDFNRAYTIQYVKEKGQWVNVAHS